MKKNLPLLFLLILLFAACTGERGAGKSVVFTAVANEVLARTSAAVDFAPTSAGQELVVGGEVSTGMDGSARLQIQPDNTFVYVAANTHFKLAEIDDKPEALFSRFNLETGKLWIVLGSGSLVVETPGGAATVHGSQMGVGTDGNNTTVTCLEGQYPRRGHRHQPERRSGL
jgi:hypothetical protein